LAIHAPFFRRTTSPQPLSEGEGPEPESTDSFIRFEDFNLTIVVSNNNLLNQLIKYSADIENLFLSHSVFVIFDGKNLISHTKGNVNS
jgi:hypothetical protein